MGVIETLLNSNLSTVVSFIVAALALAFIWYVALPRLAELKEVKSQLAEAQAQASHRDNAQVEAMLTAIRELAAGMATIQSSLEVIQTDSRRRSTDYTTSHDAMLTGIAEVRHQVSTLGQHVLNLSSAVNTAIHKDAPWSQKEGPPPYGFKGLR